MKRIELNPGAVVSGALLSVLLLLPRCASADGAFVWARGADLHEPSQKAIILHAEGVQDLILQVKYAGRAEDFCWIVPLPATPALSPVKHDVFAEVSLYTQRRWKWGYRQAGGSEVEVLAQKKVGIFDTAVLKASDADALQGWLTKHGFAFPEHRIDALRFYARKKWVFAAIRIHPDELGENVETKLREGTLQPLLFTFDSKRIVYPLYISSVNAGATEVLLFVLAGSPVSHPWFAADSRPAWANAPQTDGYESRKGTFTETWQGERYYRMIGADELPECRAALKRMGDGRFFLTRLRATFSASLMADDVVIAPSPGWAKELSARKPFAARLRIVYGMNNADFGFAHGFEGSEKAAERHRVFNSIFSELSSRPGMREAEEELLKDPVPKEGDERTCSRPAWFKRLDAYESRCLLRSALIFHRRVVTARAACGDPDRATLSYRHTDKFAMAACCEVLGRSVPKYTSWDEFQKHWPEIEAAVEELED